MLDNVRKKYLAIRTQNNDPKKYKNPVYMYKSGVDYCKHSGIMQFIQLHKMFLIIFASF